MPLASTVKGGKKRKADYGKENAENENKKTTANKQNTGAANKYLKLEVVHVEFHNVNFLKEGM